MAVRAVQLLAGLAHRLRRQHAAVLPAAEFPGGLQPGREARHRVGQAQLHQRPHHVRRDHDAGADLALLGMEVQLAAKTQLDAIDTTITGRFYGWGPGERIELGCIRTKAASPWR